jgi:UDP-glucose 4-epimerase
VTLDVTDRDPFMALALEVRPAAIIHLGALVSVPESIARPDLNRRLNVDTTRIVVEAARLAKVPRLVFASSATVYGNNPNLPLRESATPQPISPYGEAKLESESLVLAFGTQPGHAGWCLRYFNVYGPRQDPRSRYSGVIPILADQLKAGLAPVIFGDGEQSRDFISVHDVARANLNAATTATPPGGAMNICTGQATTLNRLVQVLRRRWPSAPMPTYAPARAGDIRYSLGAPERALARLGFKAEVTLEDGLVAMA